jgi:hypothetical protein
MLQGIKITDIDDLKEPCEDILEGFRKDPKARAKIAACANEVFASIEQKKLIEIKGEILEEFPVLEYENLNDFYSEIKSNKGLKDQAYKLHNSKIIFKKALTAVNDYGSPNKIEKRKYKSKKILNSIGIASEKGSHDLIKIMVATQKL